jgi:nucleotide-binding universal stress UspA family protein
MASSIICGIDDSQSAKGAARVARALAGKLGLELVFVRVLEEDAPEAEVNATAERLERLSADAHDVDFGAGWVVEAGHPADRLADVAKQREAAMIVVGSTGPRSSLLGSISADVSRRAPCPVVVVPPGSDARVDGLANGRRSVRFNVHPHRDDLDFAGGIVRFSLGGPERRN